MRLFSDLYATGLSQSSAAVMVADYLYCILLVLNIDDLPEPLENGFGDQRPPSPYDRLVTLRVAKCSMFIISQCCSVTEGH